MNSVLRTSVLGGLVAFAAMGQVQAQQLTEGFDAAVPPAGWIVRNQSTTIGSTSWFAGNLAVIPARTGAGYAGANFNSTTGTNTISTWMISPQLTMLRNGNTVSFYTRVPTGSAFADRLQLRLCVDVAAGSCGLAGSTGATDTDVGTFTTLLADVNPTLTVGGYPETYTLVTGTIAGLPAGINPGRVALRYFVSLGGPAGDNSNYIAVDDFVVSDTFPVTLQNFSID